MCTYKDIEGKKRNNTMDASTRKNRTKTTTLIHYRRKAIGIKQHTIDSQLNTANGSTFLIVMYKYHEVPTCQYVKTILGTKSESPMKHWVQYCSCENHSTV